MEQAIQAAFGGSAQSKAAVDSAGLFNMTSASSDKIKTANTQFGKDEEDSTALVPFLQLLHQQMSQTGKSSDDDAINGENITRERETLVSPGEVTSKELEPVLANMVQSGETAGLDKGQNVQAGISLMSPDEVTSKELEPVLANMVQSGETAGLDKGQNVQAGIFSDGQLNEMDLLKNNLVQGDGKSNDPLLKAVFEQAGVEEKVSNGENKAIDAVTASLEKKIKEKSGNSGSEQIINEQNVILNPSDGVILGESESELFSRDESSETYKVKIAGTNLINSTGTKADKAKADYIITQSQPENPPAEEVEIKSQGMKVQSVSQIDERMLQTEKMITREDQLSEGAAGKIAVNSVQVKAESKIADNIPPVESEKEISVAGYNSRLTAQEIKESQISKDNLRFAQEQYLSTVNAKAGNKAQSDTMQAIMGEIAGKIKTEQNGKIISGEKGKEEISLTGFNAAGNGQVGVEKTNDVSPAKIIGQVTNEIKEAVANDGGRVKITLNPPSLGKLEMDVTVRNGKVEVVMVADNKDVQQTLNTHIDKLKGGLQNQGLTIDRCDVFMQDKREEYQQNFSQQTFYQDRGSGQEGNGRRGNSEKEVKVSAIISEKPGSVLRVSTDNISLFA